MRHGRDRDSDGIGDALNERDDLSGVEVAVSPHGFPLEVLRSLNLVMVCAVDNAVESRVRHHHRAIVVETRPSINGHSLLLTPSEKGVLQVIVVLVLRVLGEA